MARYIDLDKVEFLKVEGNKEFNHGVDCCINKLLEIEPVDVIEREKFDRAIEDINTEMSYGSARFMEETMYHKGLERALEILKRNIERRGE